MQRHAVMRLAAQDDSKGDSKQLTSQHFSHNALAVTFIASASLLGEKKMTTLSSFSDLADVLNWSSFVCCGCYCTSCLPLCQTETLMRQTFPTCGV